MHATALHIKQRLIIPSAFDQTNLALTLPATLCRIYQARGIQHADDLSLQLNHLLPAKLLKGLDHAIHLLSQSIEQQTRILIIGDFDADGATSTALMVLCLKQMGAVVDFLVPDRFSFGYGLTPEIVQHAIAHFNPQMIVTVDNGISSHEGVATAQAAGIQVIITDHHLTTKQPPPADAVVNPNQLGCEFPSKALAGVGVAFYVLAALSTHQKKLGRPTVPLTDYLDLVALGTVADVAQLDKNNRILVQQGLARIQQRRCRQGILALLDIAKRKASDLQAIDLGFVLGPRINAAGRMDNMRIGIECLLSESYVDALPIAKMLDEFNQQRRNVEQHMKDEAMTLLQQSGFVSSIQTPTTEGSKKSIVLFEPTWHQGVIGIVAGRLKEQFNRPSIVFAPSDDTGLTLKGSARSIEGIHIRDAIELVAEQHAGLITHFGGHAMAAGLTLPSENFASFAKAFESIMETHHHSLFEPVLYTDGALTISDFNIPFAKLIQLSGPWGTGFPPPLFEGSFKIIQQRLLKDKHLKLTLEHPASSEWLDAIMFNVDTKQWPNTQDNVHLVFTLDINEYQGKQRLQLMVQHLH